MAYILILNHVQMSRIKMLNVNLGFNFGLVYLFMFLGRILWVLNDN